MSESTGGWSHKFRDDLISWCGEYASTGVLCFGLENGRFIIAPERPTDEPRILETGATEPINGVAFAGPHIALTTRREVIVLARPDERSDFTVCRLDQVGGAHDVAAAADRDAFVAAIGPDGLLIATPRPRESVDVQVAQGPGHPFNCCRIVRLAGAPGQELFAVAARTDGLLIAQPFHPDAPLVNRRFRDHDVIDVRPLGDPEFPHAALCVSRERGLFFLEDVLRDDPAVGIVYRDIQGVAYSIAVAAGHVFLLTDRELLAFPDLASRFLRDRESLRRPLVVTAMPCDAFELATFRDNVLLLEDGAAEEYKAADLAAAVEVARPLIASGGIVVGGAAELTILKKDMAPSVIDLVRSSTRQVRLEITTAA